jgi:hypothetical protein
MPLSRIRAIRLPLHFFLIPLLTVACSQPASAPEGRPSEPVEAYLPSSGSVGFDIQTLPSPAGSSRWKAVYASHGKAATFVIELGPGKRSGGANPSDFEVTFGEGRFVAEPGSDSSVLLPALKTALEAKMLPNNVRKATSIPFTYAVIAQHQSQASGGGFNATPSGNWTAIKLFVGKGDQECEIYLNVNSALAKGEFSIKDAEYGDLLLAQLAKVL